MQRLVVQKRVIFSDASAFDPSMQLSDYKKHFDPRALVMRTKDACSNCIYDCWLSSHGPNSQGHYQSHALGLQFQLAIIRFRDSQLWMALHPLRQLWCHAAGSEQ
jgi:hypothetical protein